MRVGLLTTSYPRDAADHAGRFVAEMASALADRGDRVEVLAPYPARTQDPRVHVRGVRYALWPRLLYGAGAPENLGGGSWWRRAHVASQAPAFVATMALSARVARRGWDALISHWLVPSAAVGALVAPHLPHLAVAHSADVHLLERLPGAALLLERLAATRSALLLASETLRPPLARLARSPRASRLVAAAAVERMGCAATLLSQPRPTPQRRALVLFVGRLVPVKGVDLLLQASAGAPWQLVVAGSGPERPRLERQARALGVDVRFAGSLDAAGKQRWLARADVFVAPSRRLPDGRSDSAPVAPLEALAAGVPLVASDVGANRALLAQCAAGRVVAPGAVDALRAAIAELVNDARSSVARRDELAAAARARAAPHAWPALAARLAATVEAL